MLTVEVHGGLTSRLDVVQSIVASSYYPDKIKMIWPKVPGLMANFNDLYSNDFGFEYKDPDKSIPQYECGIELNPNDNRIIFAGWPIKFPDTNIDYDFRNENILKKYKEFYKSLQPVSEIQDVVNRYSTQFENKTCGINIRRGAGINYHPNSSVFSPIGLFVGISQEIKRRGQKTFVATDSYHDLDNLCLFDDNLIYVQEYLKYPLDDGYTLNGMKRTVIDWYLLTKTLHLYISKDAGFAKRVNRVYNMGLTEIITNDKQVNEYFEKKQARLRKELF